MFSARKLLSNTSIKQNQLLVKQPIRHFQQFSKNYMNGFDRMLVDKNNMFKIGGWMFTLFGVANIAAYGASHLMTPENYRYHFAYEGERYSMSRFFKAMVGSNTFANVAWTAPTLIALNWYMHCKVGSVVMMKFFFLTMVSTYIFYSALGPQTGLNVRPLQPYLIKFDSYADDGSYTMGADQLAQSLCYFALLSGGYWSLALGFMAFDTLYYGPSTLGGPVAAVAGALMFF